MGKEMREQISGTVKDHRLVTKYLLKNLYNSQVTTTSTSTSRCTVAPSSSPSRGSLSLAISPSRTSPCPSTAFSASASPSLLPSQSGTTCALVTSHLPYNHKTGSTEKATTACRLQQMRTLTTSLMQGRTAGHRTLHAASTLAQSVLGRISRNPRRFCTSSNAMPQRIDTSRPMAGEDFDQLFSLFKQHLLNN